MTARKKLQNLNKVNNLKHPLHQKNQNLQKDKIK
jgi:hypothetical protein